MSSTMNENMREQTRSSQRSRGSQTPRKRTSRSNPKTRVLSKESTIEPPSIPPPANSPRTTSIIDSHYSASKYNLLICHKDILPHNLTVK